jgi:hypothetical protein
MKKKGQRTKLPLLAFEADSWTVDINYRKPASQARRADKSPRTGAPRVSRTSRIELHKPSGVWAATPGFIRDYCQ